MGKFEVQNVDSVKMYKIRKTLEELTQHSGRGNRAHYSIHSKRSTTS